LAHSGVSQFCREIPGILPALICLEGKLATLCLSLRPLKMVVSLSSIFWVQSLFGKQKDKQKMDCLGLSFFG
jgi:hypothetical protein